MKIRVEIDKGSGFCGGVIRAIKQAESYLKNGEHLYSLGSIVHNEEELQRLSDKGLVTVDKCRMEELGNGETLFIRAHGEPPATYQKAEELGLKVIDCTCPVVLKLQERIRKAYERVSPLGGLILIFGKVGHAEVLGLVGQVDGNAIVIENEEMYREFLRQGRIDLSRPIEIFSQTTKSPQAFSKLCDTIAHDISEHTHISKEEIYNKQHLTIHNTICTQVSNRHEGLITFAKNHSIIIFVSGKESSNGKVLFKLCQDANPRTYFIGNEKEIDTTWFKDNDFVGVCGATSTPKWLLETVANKILEVL